MAPDLTPNIFSISQEASESYPVATAGVVLAASLADLLCNSGMEPRFQDRMKLLILCTLFSYLLNYLGKLSAKVLLHLCYGRTHFLQSFYCFQPLSHNSQGYCSDTNCYEPANKMIFKTKTDNHDVSCID